MEFFLISTESVDWLEAQILHSMVLLIYVYLFNFQMFIFWNKVIYYLIPFIYYSVTYLKC